MNHYHTESSSLVPASDPPSFALFASYFVISPTSSSKPAEAASSPSESSHATRDLGLQVAKGRNSPRLLGVSVILPVLCSFLRRSSRLLDSSKISVASAYMFLCLVVQYLEPLVIFPQPDEFCLILSPFLSQGGQLGLAIRLALYRNGYHCAFASCESRSALRACSSAWVSFPPSSSTRSRRVSFSGTSSPIWALCAASSRCSRAASPRDSFSSALSSLFS